MVQCLEVYKCLKCNMIIEVKQGSPVDAPICCGEHMKLMKEGSTDGAKEKHVPVVEKTANGYKVKVGSVAHPMQEDHWIQWIELVADGVAYTRFLKPGEAPEAEFCIADAKNVYAREYCNLHGHWKS